MYTVQNNHLIEQDKLYFQSGFFDTLHLEHYIGLSFIFIISKS